MSLFTARSRRRPQRGDTIIEVLICVGVIGAVLAGAFVVTNRSQLAVRDAQEHAEASKLLEGQLELLRSNAKFQKGTVFHPTTTGDFCMDLEAKPVANGGGNAGACKVDNGGQPWSEDTNSIPYFILIKNRDNASGTDNAGQLFQIQVKWDSVTGKGEAQETMYYRLYP